MEYNFVLILLLYIFPPSSNIVYAQKQDDIISIYF